MSLAAWRYRNAHRKQGGPIEKITFLRTPATGDFEVYAYLRKELRPSWLKKPGLYGDPDGTGTSPSRARATYKAISEALERWAFYSVVDSKEAGRFGFKLEPTTTGMAAYPEGWVFRSARESAYCEALERWTVQSWWEGTLPNSPAASFSMKHRSIHWCELLQSTSDQHRVAVVWNQDPANHRYSYGYACERDLKTAIRRAVYEMDRSAEALARITLNSLAQNDLIEDRVVYFSNEDGHRRFLRRVNSAKSLKLSFSGRARLWVDSEISGPWSSYATVWRCLFEPTSQEHLKTTADYFLF
jgi:hypothetical protein